MYAAVTSKQKNTKCQSVGAQTECFKNSESQVFNREIQLQSSNKNSSKHLEKETETLNSQKSTVPKPSLYKKTIKSTSNEKHPINQN